MQHLGPLSLLWLLACGDRSPDGHDPLPGAGVPRRVVGGLVFTEGPLWDEARGGLLFTELERPLRGCGGRILFWQEPSTLTTLRAPSCNANGLALDRDGALLAAEHGSRSITRQDPEGQRATLVAGYGGQPLNAPNDLALRSDGTLYFTDPDFVGPAPPLLGFNGLYRLVPGEPEPRLEARLDGPNGVALAPDEATLYVSEMRLGEVLAFDVLPSGELGGRRVLARDAPDADGLAVDVEGNVYVATSAGETGAVLVFGPDGTRRGSIAIDEPARNCAFGGADRRTLFVTAGGSVWSVRMAVPGPSGSSGPGAPRAPAGPGNPR